MSVKASPSSTQSPFLDHAISPIYNFLYNQLYKSPSSNIRRERDHAQIIGYDDVNETFWSLDSIASLTSNGVSVISMPPWSRYEALAQTDWKFKKTFLERRTWCHVIVNFQRVWVLHLAPYFAGLGWVVGYASFTSNQPFF